MGNGTAKPGTGKIRGVQYAPHFVGEPTNGVGSSVLDAYRSVHRLQHRQHLQLIASHLDANTLRLQPWDNRRSESDSSHQEFFSAVRSNGIGNLIPTFQLSKQFYDSISKGNALFRGPESPIILDLQRFVSSAIDIEESSGPGTAGKPRFRAWSLDLALNVEDLWGAIPPDGQVDDCSIVEPSADSASEQSPFQRYRDALTAMANWVWAEGQGVPPWFQDRPLLVPLDLASVAGDQWPRARALLRCLTVWLDSTLPNIVGTGREASGGLFGSGKAAWLLAFTLPMPSMMADIPRNTSDCSKEPLCASFVHRGFTRYLDDLVNNTFFGAGAALKPNIVVMVAAHALAYDTGMRFGDIIEDYGTNADGKWYPTSQQVMLVYAWKEYLRRERENPNLEGFIIDEWMDNWDRGSSGPFVLAEAAAARGACGSRFFLDRGARCRRQQTLYDDHSTYFAYPEAVGMAATLSRLFFHCAKPRLLHSSQPLFSEQDYPMEFTGPESLACSVMIPYPVAGCVFGGILLLSLVLLFGFKPVRPSCGAPPAGPPERAKYVKAECPAELAECPIEAARQCLKGDFRIRTAVPHWWLRCHCGTQLAILERQLAAEVLAMQACRERVAGGVQTDEAELEAAAMRTLHQRCFEGFDAWRKHVRLPVVGIDPQQRPSPQLFAECVLMRTVESLGEHIINCPERISWLLYGILQNTGSSHTYEVDLEQLHDGLARMMHNSNPFKTSNVASLMPGIHKGGIKDLLDGHRQFELGLNFDDINNSGIQCLPYVRKSFMESRSVFVLLDLVLSYRVTIMIKLWMLVLAFYFYLGNGIKNHAMKYNGSLLAPQYTRLDLWFYASLVDAAIWIVLELLVLVYSGSQHRATWRSNTPGSPNLHWLLQHTACLLFSVGGLSLIRYEVDLHSCGWRPASCLNSDVGDCIDPRVQVNGHYSYTQLLCLLKSVVGYWLLRFIVFYWLHRRRWPTFIYGRPDPEGAEALNLKVLLIWTLMLACCITWEANVLLPTTGGLTWANHCGLDIADVIGGHSLHSTNPSGVCKEHWVTSSCMPCLLSVAFVWLLVFLTCLIDIFFVFTIFSAIVGGIEGNFRELNDLKNTGVVIDFRQEGRELELMQKVFGPRWRDLWRTTVYDLRQESLIGRPQEEALLKAMVKGECLDISGALYGCNLAAERLCVFFGSLKGILGSGKVPWVEDFDALTAERLHVGSIPSVSMIIPAYNEVVMPSRQRLIEGSRPEDARNQLAGANERTLPPRGDGVNTNLGFLISEFEEEWAFLADRLNHEDPKALYSKFVTDPTVFEDWVCREIRKWAAMRTQTVGKTVIGGLKYLRALASLPAIQQFYAQHEPQVRVPELHAELLLADQSFGSARNSVESDRATRALMQENADLPFYLVFDLHDDTVEALREDVRRFLAARHGGAAERYALRYARVKCCWSKRRNCLQVMEVLPRRFPLRVGSSEDFMTQGKASNQLNALLFASGHCLQAMDCNMGTFIGECYKVPFVLRGFLPLDAQWPPKRTSVQCRYIGFREFIFTSREGVVGSRHAATEWTFGTIFQRFLSILQMRMHYGHPDFLDGFWARNRGGMSRCSPVVNLSEDIFAGYNVRMREEKSPHTDILEFEKGREATLNASSNFFFKIAAGSVAILRSRDNRLLSERMGILHGLSFYFASIAFYVNHLLVDITIYVYVLVLILFSLASLSPGILLELNSSLGTEWIFSMGLFNVMPQFVELIIEYGATTAVARVLSSVLSSTLFFIFENKAIASSMKQGISTGNARYLATGRPAANQHQTWKDMYTLYWKTHYDPGLSLMVLYITYCMLAGETELGRLPMILVILSFCTWLLAPLVFSPYPKWRLVKYDLTDFSSFISSRAGMEAEDIEEVVVRASSLTCRSLYELGVAVEICQWTELPLRVNLLLLLCNALCMLLLLTALPAGILEFALPIVAMLGIQWLFIWAFLRGARNNIYMALSIVIWPCTPFVGRLLIGDRTRVEDWWTRRPEYVVSALVYFAGLRLVKRSVILCAALWNQGRVWCLKTSEKEAERSLKLMVRTCYFYFFEYQTRLFWAYAILCINLAVSLVLMLVDTHCFGFGLHSWWLLNSAAARAQPKRDFMGGSGPGPSNGVASTAPPEARAGVSMEVDPASRRLYSYSEQVCSNICTLYL